MSARHLSRVLPAIVALAFTTVCVDAASAAPQEDLDLAITAFNLKDYENAAEGFAKYLDAADPKAEDVPLARFYLGFSLVQLEKFPEARKALETYLRNHPQGKYVANARYQLAWSSYLAGEHETAAKELQSFLESHGKDELAQYALAYLGDAQLQLDQPDEAAETFARSLEEHPKGVMAEDSRMGLARAFEQLDRRGEAVEQYRAVADDPRATRRVEAQFRLGNALFDEGKHSEAAVAYDRLVERFPKSEYVPQAVLNAGFAFREAGFAKDAVARFEKAAEFESLAATARYWNGVTHEALGEYEQASELFARAHAAADGGPEAPRILYRWGQSELAREAFDSAGERLRELVTKFPEHELADDALHFAAESALRAGRVEEADDLVERFAKEYPRSPLAIENELLAGRIDLAAETPERTERAVSRFESVLERAEDAETKNLARYQLVRARFRLDDHAGVIRDAAPLRNLVEERGSESPFVDALLLQSTSLLAEKKYEESSAAASAYLKLQPKGPQAPRAIANRARAEAALGNETPAKHNLTLLANLAPDSPLVAETTFDVAEIAYDAGEYAWAAELYDRVAEAGKDSPYRARALSGAGWSSFELERFDDAAKRFGTLAAEHAEHPRLGPESLFMQGESLKRDGELKEAARVLAAAFDELAPEEAAPAGAATGEGPLRYAFESGKEAARVRRKLGEVEQADALYRRVADLFPNVPHHDRLLDEWALLHYEAERYDAADAVWERLLKEHPDSDRADDARLQLAESANVAGRTDEAAAEFRALAEDESSDADVREIAREHLVEIAVATQDWKGVLSATATLLEEFPETEFASRATFRRGEAQLMRDDHAAARETLAPLRARKDDPALRKQDWFDRVWVLLAETHFRDKNYDEVDALVAELRESSPESPFLYQADEVLGRALKQRARFAEAREAFQRVVESEHGRRTETAAKAQMLLADTYVQQSEKDYPAAHREYLKVYALYDFPVWRAKGLFQAANTNAALGKRDAAKRAYEELLVKFPESEHAADAAEKLKKLQ